MPFVPGAETPYPWRDYPSTTTPLNSADLQAMEANVVNWATAQIEALDTFLEGILASNAGATFTGQITAPDLKVSGLTGATAASRYVGATASGAPVSGSFVVGDWVLDQSGAIWVCTSAGTPGTWTQIGGGGGVAGVATFNGRAGSVVPTSGDYTAAQVTNAADKSSGSQQAFTGEVKAPDFTPAGLTGATAASRYVGATASGAPASGTFSVGDWAVDQTGAIWVCTVAGSPGTWAQVGGGGLSGGTAGGGAQTGTYTRTSTIAAPTLRDFVSLNDATWSATGNGVTDDSTAVSNAITALNNKGGGTLLIPPLNPAGNQALWTIQRVSANGWSNITISAYGARAQYLSSSSGGSMFKGDNSSSNPGTYQINGFKLLGLTVVGTGSENALNQSVVEMDRASDVTVRDTYVSLWNGSVYYFLDSQRIRLEDNTIINCSHGGANPINISIQNTSSGNSAVLQSLYVCGNEVTGCHTAPVAISFGSPANVTTLLLSVIYSGGSAPTGGGLDIGFTQTQYVTATLNATTSVTGISPNQTSGCVFNVTGTNIPASTTLTITGTTTGTLSNAATGSGSVTLTLTASFSTSGTAIAYNSTAAAAQTAINTAIAAQNGPSSAVNCYGGPLGQNWSGSTAPNGPIVIVPAAALKGSLGSLTVTNALTGGSNATPTLTYPGLKMVVTGNHLESDNWTALAVELGGTNAGGGVAGEVAYEMIISHNLLYYIGANAGSCYGMALTNDSNPSIPQGALYRRVLINGNIVDSNRSGMLLNGNDITASNNTVRAGNYGYQVQPGSGGSANPCSQIHISGGVVHMNDSTASGAGILFNGVNDSSITNVPIYWDTGGSGTSEGIYVQNSSRVDIVSRVNYAPQRGMRISSCGEVHVHTGSRVYNPSSNATTAGIRVDGTLTGNIHIHERVQMRDDRGGSAKMTNGVDATSATLNGFSIFVREPDISGNTGNATAGTIVLTITYPNSQSVAYAATITPDPTQGRQVVVGTLTGAVTIANPTVTVTAGTEMTFVFTQDATGGRTISFGTSFKKNWTPVTTASAINTIMFKYDGTNWNQIAASTGIS